ncbi:MAG: hypothetical protein JST85_28550 [Acidobacteria bacterium]|nr:hypothetical protein [Acidobacteriota bacterium]
MPRSSRIEWWKFILISMLILLVVGSATAQTTSFTYQGYLTDGSNPATGVYDLQFRLLDALGGGNQVGSTLVRDDVAVNNGIFSVTLDFGATAFPGANRWLEIGVRPGASTGTFSLLNPRQPITSTPYSIQSLNAVTANSAMNLSGSLAGDVTGTQSATTLANGAVTTAKLADGSVTDAKINDVAGSKVTGTLPVASIPAGSGNYVQNGMALQAASNFNISGNGVIGGSLGIGLSNPAGSLHVKGVSPVRILGDTTTLSGTESVDFFARSSLFNSDLGGMRIQRQANGNIDTLFFAAQLGNSATEKMRITGNGYVGIGTSIPQSLLHLRMDAASAPGPTLTLMNGAGGLGASANIDFSTYDTAGGAPTARISAVHHPDASGETADIIIYTRDNVIGDPLGEVLRITADGRVGIGTAFASIGQEMLFVRPIGNYLAARFVGNVNVTGGLTAASKSFKIDHPLDPENKYLYHVAIESPDMKNLYDGVVTLGANGEAEVELPTYFQALNRDFRYQLTCLGDYAPVYIAKKIQGNRFKIAGGRPGLEVSWQVTGIRQDAWANQHRVVVEEEKPSQERGHYLHPELFGQPEEKSEQSARDPELMTRMKERREQIKSLARPVTQSNRP